MKNMGSMGNSRDFFYFVAFWCVLSIFIVFFCFIITAKIIKKNENMK